MPSEQLLAQPRDHARTVAGDVARFARVPLKVEQPRLAAVVFAQQLPTTRAHREVREVSDAVEPIAVRRSPEEERRLAGRDRAAEQGRRERLAVIRDRPLQGRARDLQLGVDSLRRRRRNRLLGRDYSQRSNEGNKQQGR